eukprot:4884271-Amphidinium_carterae.1
MSPLRRLCCALFYLLVQVLLASSLACVEVFVGSRCVLAALGCSLGLGSRCVLAALGCCLGLGSRACRLRLRPWASSRACVLVNRPVACDRTRRWFELHSSFN